MPCSRQKSVMYRPNHNPGIITECLKVFFFFFFLSTMSVMKHYKYTHAAPVIPQDIYIDECSTNLMEAHIY